MREMKRREEYRAEREKRTAMFTTPGLVPLAMPPTIDWEVAGKYQLHSDLLHEKLFSGDRAKQ